MYEQQYARLREGFQRLRDDFLTAQCHWPGLYWDWFAASPVGWEWIRTMEVETAQCWEVPPEAEECYRYTGNLAGLEEFRRLAETGVRLCPRCGPFLYQSPCNSGYRCQNRSVLLQPLQATCVSAVRFG